MARLEARFRLLPWPLTRVQRIWLLFASMDVPRRIARERVPTMGVEPYTPYVDADGRPPERNALKVALLGTKEGIGRDFRLPSVWHDDSSEIDALAGRIHACELFSARNRQSPQAPPRGAFHGR